jgi:hypothetical protein
MYEEGLRVMWAVLDPLHSNIAVTLSNITQIYSQYGDWSAAFRFYEELNAIQMASVGVQHPTVALTLANMALTLPKREIRIGSRPISQSIENMTGGFWQG